MPSRRSCDNLLEAIVWEENFESGTTSGWESYPPFQDTAYDFTIYPGRFIDPAELRGGVFSGGEHYPPSGLAPPATSQPNAHYLVRGFKPEGSHAQRLGTWCKTPGLWSADALSVSFDYWMEDRRDHSEIEVHLAGGDGSRYVTRVEPASRAWTTVSLGREAFVCTASETALPSDVSIDAIAIVMNMPETDPTAYVYLAIDNVRIGGRQSLPVEYKTPSVKQYQHWKHGLVESVYGPDDPLEFEASIKTDALSAELILSFGLEGSTLHTIPLQIDGGVLRLAEAREFSTTDPFGPWVATLEATTSDGCVMRDSIRFWRLDNPPAERPRLLFDAAQTAELRQRAKEGRGKEIYDKISANARGARAKLPPEEANIAVYLDDYLLRDIGSYFAVLRTPSYDALNNAFVYLVEGDQEAGLYAREVLLLMAAWETWTHPNFHRLGRTSYYPIGIVSTNLALAFDMVHPLLSKEDQDAIRQGIQRNAIETGWSEYFLHNRVANHTSNWVTGTTAGPALAVLSLYDSPAEFPPEFVGLMEKWMAHLHATWLTDGSYGEGYGYHNFAAYKGVATLAALDHAYGATELEKVIPLHETFLYPIYMTADDRTILEMGDNYGDLQKSSINAAWSVHRTADPVLSRWFRLNPGADWRELVWPSDPANQMHPREAYTPSRHFGERGSVVFRTGWEPDDIIVNFRAGPNYNHTHADQGHFILWGHGELLAHEGDLSGYYEDPYFWTYNIHAGAHNVLIIDRNIQSQEFGDFKDEVPAFDNYAHITAIALDKSAGIVLSDLRPVYAGDLAKYERAMAFTPAGNVLVWDEVESLGNDHQFELYYHPPKPGRTKTMEQGAVYMGERARLHIRVLDPPNAVLGEREVPTLLAELRDHPNPQASRRHVVTIGNAGLSSSVRFLTAYLPVAGGDALEPRAEKLEIGGGVGARIQEPGGEIIAVLSDQGMSAAGVVSDARMLMIQSGPEGPVIIWALQAKSMMLHGQSIFISEDPTDVVLHRESDGEWKPLNRQAAPAANVIRATVAR
jgi:hypothetical protein